MKIIETAKLADLDLTLDETYYTYNALDSCLTLEIDAELEKLHTPESRTIYSFELAQRSPALEMMTVGIAINPVAHAQMIDEVRAKAADLRVWINQITEVIWGKPINPNSPPQLQKLLYGHMHFEKQYIFDKGEKRVSVNRECLERLFEKYLYSRPFISALFALRDAEKKEAVLRSSVGHDRRFHTSYNVGGTETGRWSASKDAFGEGWNSQNITESLREVFVSDPGCKICYADLEQAESYGVANLSGDEAYIRACNSGDLHTTVAKLIWPELDWPDDPIEAKILAEKPFYRHFSRRYMAKRGGHGSNYYGKPYTMAKHLKIETSVMDAFQDAYFSAFPGIPRWHEHVQQVLQATGELTTPLGRKRIFFGRLRDDSTLREAIAYEPQSLIADILNYGLYRVWKYLGTDPAFQILGQVHDAILFQYREDRPELVQSALDLMRFPVLVNGRIMEIPVEAKVGYDWKNLEPLGSEKEQAQVRPSYSLLDRIY